MCRTEDLTPTVAQYPCEESGEIVQYISVGYESQGVLLSRSGFEEWTDQLAMFDGAASDEYGTGELRIHSYRLDNVEQAFWTVATQIHRPEGAAPYRRAVTFFWELNDGTWRVSGVSDLGLPPEVESVLTAPDRSDTWHYLPPDP
jgi:hypothetical protein